MQTIDLTQAGKTKLYQQSQSPEVSSKDLIGWAVLINLLNKEPFDVEGRLASFRSRIQSTEVLPLIILPNDRSL